MRCGACGKAFVPDDDHPEIFDRACDCMTCGHCGLEYKADDDNGPQLASTDEESNMDGWCARCQSEERERKMIRPTKHEQKLLALAQHLKLVSWRANQLADEWDPKRKREHSIVRDLDAMSRHADRAFYALMGLFPRDLVEAELNTDSPRPKAITALRTQMAGAKKGLPR